MWQDPELANSTRSALNLIQVVILSLFTNVLAQRQSVSLGVVPPVWYLLNCRSLPASSFSGQYCRSQPVIGQPKSSGSLLATGAAAGVPEVPRLFITLGMSALDAINTSGIVDPSQFILHRCD